MLTDSIAASMLLEIRLRTGTERERERERPTASVAAAGRRTWPVRRIGAVELARRQRSVSSYGLVALDDKPRTLTDDNMTSSVGL